LNRAITPKTGNIQSRGPGGSALIVGGLNKK
jgi:hypothetical protein